MAHAREAAQIADQQLAAPHRPVAAEPAAVVDRADRAAGLAVLGQDRGQVSVVVLDADVAHPVALQCVARRQVVGVQVVRDDLGGDGEQALEVRGAVGEGEERLVVAQVADVVADPGPRPLGDAERALELGAAREDRDPGLHR